MALMQDHWAVAITLVYEDREEGRSFLLATRHPVGPLRAASLAAWGFAKHLISRTDERPEIKVGVWRRSLRNSEKGWEEVGAFSASWDEARQRYQEIGGTAVQSRKAPEVDFIDYAWETGTLSRADQQRILSAQVREEQKEREGEA